MQSRKLLIELKSNKNFFDFDVSALTFDSRKVKEEVFFLLYKEIEKMVKNH